MDITRRALRQARLAKWQAETDLLHTFNLLDRWRLECGEKIELNDEDIEFLD